MLQIIAALRSSDPTAASTYLTHLQWVQVAEPGGAWLTEPAVSTAADLARYLRRGNRCVVEAQGQTADVLVESRSASGAYLCAPAGEQDLLHHLPTIPRKSHRD